MRLDFHTHVFRPAAARVVIEQMCAQMGIQAAGTGVIDDLRMRLAAANLHGAVMLYSPPKPAMIRAANLFVLEQQAAQPDFVAFGSVHPHAKDWEAELDFLRQAGIKGLKLHPEYQGYSLEEPEVEAMLRAAAPHFVFLCHMGGLVPGVTPATVQAAPHMLARLLDRVPGMRFVAAHFGGQYLWEEALEHLAGRDDVWLDTAAALRSIAPELLRQILDRHDPEKIIFGSDYPFYDPAVEIRLLERIMGPDNLEKSLNNGATLLDL